LNELDQAIAHLQQSVTILSDLNREFDLGTALYDYAQALNQAGQVPSAKEQLLETLALFERLELPQEQARARALLDRLG
jgi:tetratricopeptide (TPR) repeat protein